MSKPSISGRLPIKQAVIDANTIASHEIVAAVSGKSIRVISLFFTTTSAATLTWKSDTTAITGPMDFEALGGMSATAEDGLMWTTRGEALNLDLADAVQVSGALTYIEV